VRGLTSAGDEGVLLVVADDAVRSANANPGLGLHGRAKSLRGDSGLGVEGGTLEARPEGRREAWDGSGCQTHMPKQSPSMVPQKNCVTMFPCPLPFSILLLCSHFPSPGMGNGHVTRLPKRASRDSEASARSGTRGASQTQAAVNPHIQALPWRGVGGTPRPPPLQSQRPSQQAPCSKENRIAEKWSHTGGGESLSPGRAEGDSENTLGKHLFVSSLPAWEI